MRRTAMPLLDRDGRRVVDIWTPVKGCDPLPSRGAVLVTLDRWHAERETLLARDVPLGVKLASDQHPAGIADDLDRLRLVALDFPKYRDGRAFSYARLLRERHGFNGELRAIGNVLQDQFLFMLRCGFDTFAVEKDADAEAFSEAVKRFSVWYQPAADDRPTAMALRQRQAVAE